MLLSFALCGLSSHQTFGNFRVLCKETPASSSSQPWQGAPPGAQGASPGGGAQGASPGGGGAPGALPSGAQGAAPGGGGAQGASPGPQGASPGGGASSTRGGQAGR